MTILDAYAVLALLKGEPAASAVQQLLQEDPDASLTAVGLAEVVDHLVRLEHASDEDAALDLAQLGLAEPAPVDAALALRGGLLRARHYRRTRCAVSLSDCVAVEAARASNVAVATADPHLLDVCNDEGIEFVVLSDSHGRMWSAPSP